MLLRAAESAQSVGVGVGAWPGSLGTWKATPQLLLPPLEGIRKSWLLATIL